MNYTFADYEAAILAALASLEAPNGYLKTLKGYAGELDEVSAFETFTRGFPGILVEIEGARYEPVTMPFHYQEINVNLLIGSRSYRDQDEARGGTTGVFTILNDVRTLLLGKDLNLEIRPLILNTEDKLPPLNPRVVLYLAKYTIINDRIQEV